MSVDRAQRANFFRRLLPSPSGWSEECFRRRLSNL
jgi:hypothetical protein